MYLNVRKHENNLSILNILCCITSHSAPGPTHALSLPHSSALDVEDISGQLTGGLKLPFQADAQTQSRYAFHKIQNEKKSNEVK